MIDPDGDELTGTYHEKTDKPGKGFLHFEPTNLSAYMLIKVENFAAGENVTDIAVGTPQGNLYPKVKENKKGLTFTLNNKIKADVNATVEGVPETSTATLTIKLKGTRTPDPPQQDTEGPAWRIATDETVTMKGMKKYTEQNNIEIILGPNTDLQLAANEVLVIGGVDEPDPAMLTGTYSQKKNKITFHGLEDEFMEIVKEKVEKTFEIQNDIQSYSDVQVLDVEVNALATNIKPGKSIKLNVIVKFEGTAYVNGEFGQGKGTLHIKGDGVPAP